MAKPNDKEQTFEAAITRLERIVGEMEAESLPLEKLLAHYEEGSKLVNECQAKLTDFEKKIEIIGKTASGAVETKPFTPPAEGEPGDESKPAARAKKDVNLF